MDELEERDEGDLGSNGEERGAARFIGLGSGSTEFFGKKRSKEGEQKGLDKEFVWLIGLSKMFN